MLIPRLFPFMSHSSSSVRRSALLTLQKLAELDTCSGGVVGLSVGPLQAALRHLFQRGLLETVGEVQGLIPRVWGDLLVSADLGALLLAACPLFGPWLGLAMTPPRVPIDPNALLPPTHTNHHQKV